VSALHRAVPFVKVDAVAVLVGEDLHFDVPAPNHRVVEEQGFQKGSKKTTERKAAKDTLNCRMLVLTVLGREEILMSSGSHRTAKGMSCDLGKTARPLLLHRLHRQ